MSSLSESSTLPQLTKYEIVEELGHGGMATVYKARDVRLGREVAVKIIHKHLRENREMAARFEAEARTVAKLRHPNIVEVYDVSSEDEPDKYIVVQLSRGMTLRRLLGRVGEIPAEIAALIGIELGQALAHAHAAGVIHRDLKPENVLIETDEEVKVQLTDFGIAKILDAQGVTSTGQVLGSPAHMAPEQIDGGDVDARADVFGLGVLLYECMVGHLPFEGKNPAQVLRRVLDGSYAPAERERPSVGERWGRMLARALAKEATDRFASAEELTHAMRAELESLGFTDSATELRAFFADPDAYRGVHRERIVAALTRRGEQARRARDLHGAAADFNRALAYAPRDPMLIRLIGRLRRGRATRRALGVVLAGSAAVGLVAFGVKLALPRGSKPVTSAATLEVRPALPVVPSAEPRPASSAFVTPSAVAAPRTTSDRSPRHVEPVSQREVTFNIFPKGASVSIDDGPPEQLFMKTKRLSVGPHMFRATVPNSKCCDPLERAEEIKADDGSGTAQRVSLSLNFRDAEISAPGAPAGAQLRCPLVRVAGPASERFSVKMTEPQEDVSCDLEAPGVSTRQSSITLKAGELIFVPWSAP